MNLKQKVKTYSFWISLISAILIVVRIVGEHFGWFINESFIMDIVTGICGILVLLGILSSPTNKEESMEETINNLKEQSEQIQNQQKELNQTIKEDVQEKQLSIAEQIALLKQNAEKSSTAEDVKEKIEQTELPMAEPVEQINQPQTEQNENFIDETIEYGIVFVPESEVVAPVLREDGKEVDPIIEETTEQPETLDLGVQIPNGLVIETENYAQPEDFGKAEEIKIETIESCQDTNTLETIEPNIMVESQDNSTWLATQESTSNQEELLATDIDFSKLSNEQLKAILFEIMQRL